MKSKTEQEKKDLAIIKALCNGTHLNDSEKARAYQLIHWLKLELERRV